MYFSFSPVFCHGPNTGRIKIWNFNLTSIYGSHSSWIDVLVLMEKFWWQFEYVLITYMIFNLLTFRT